MQPLSPLARSFKIRGHLVCALQSVVLSTSLLPTIQSIVSSDNKRSKKAFSVFCSGQKRVFPCLKKKDKVDMFFSVMKNVSDFFFR